MSDLIWAKTSGGTYFHRYDDGPNERARCGYRPAICSDGFHGEVLVGGWPDKDACCVYCLGFREKQSPPLSDEDKGQLRQIENRQEVYDTDTQELARITLKLAEHIEHITKSK